MTTSRSGSPTRYTIVQHSAWATGRDPHFERGLETAAIPTAKTEQRIRAAGGLVFDTYAQAAAFEDTEPYPPGQPGVIPAAPGTFDYSLTLDGRALYLPAHEQRYEIRVEVTCTRSYRGYVRAASPPQALAKAQAAVEREAVGDVLTLVCTNSIEPQWAQARIEPAADTAASVDALIGEIE